MDTVSFHSTAMAITAAFLFALGAHFSKLGLRDAESRDGVLIQITVSALLLWLAAPFFLVASYWFVPVIFLFAVIGVFRPFLASRLAMAGNHRLGPTIASTIGGISPLFGVALGALVLGEALTPAVIIGTISIFIGITVLSTRRNGAPRGWPLWVLLLPIGAALVRALTNLFAKIGLEILDSPYFASLIAATIGAAVALAVTRDRVNPALVRHASFKWFALTGACYALATLALNGALSHGKLVAVAPVLAISPLFVLFLGAFVFGEKTITIRVVLSMALIVPSIVAITMGY